jgi:oleate hydratase
MKKKTAVSLAALGALTAAAAAGIIVAKKKKQKQLPSREHKSLTPKRNIYIAGGGISALACAYYLIRDCGVSGENIHIFEGSSTLGGAYNVGGNMNDGYICTPPKLISRKGNPNLLDMLKDLKSALIPNMSVYDEIREFSDTHPIYENMRLADDNGKAEQSLSRKALKNIKSLLGTKSEDLSEMSVEDYFADCPDFLDSSLWYIISSLHILKPASSVLELKNILGIMSEDISGLYTMDNFIRPQYNMQETIIHPLIKYLDSHQTDITTGCTVTDVDFEEGSSRISAIHLYDNGTAKTIYLNKNDLCFITNGSVSECAVIGDINTPPADESISPTASALWEKMSQKRSGFGCPDNFSHSGDEILTFAVTAKSSLLYDCINEFTSNDNMCGCFTTFKNSPWGLTLASVPQPYFTDQSDDIYVICGFCTTPEKNGNYINKSASQATGGEILSELISLMGMDEMQEDIFADTVNVIPCLMPFAATETMPRGEKDKPEIIPDSRSNFAFIGQFANLCGGISSGSEYAVRSAREAAYRLTDTKKPVAMPKKISFAAYIRLMRALKS